MHWLHSRSKVRAFEKEEFPAVLDLGWGCACDTPSTLSPLEKDMLEVRPGHGEEKVRSIQEQMMACGSYCFQLAAPQTSEVLAMSAGKFFYAYLKYIFFPSFCLPSSFLPISERILYASIDLCTYRFFSPIRPFSILLKEFYSEMLLHSCTFWS